MKQLLACAILLGLASSASATEYGNVISVNPVVQRSTVMLSSCFNADGSAKPGCESIGAPQSQTVGYQIQYMYKGHTYTAQVPSDPGKTVALQFDTNTGEPTPAIAYPMVNPYAGAPAVTPANPPPMAYNNSPYYGPAYYAPAYYDPLFLAPPVIGVGIALGIGIGGGYRDGWGGGYHNGWGGGSGYHRR